MDPKVANQSKLDAKGESGGIHGHTPIHGHASDTVLDEERTPGMFKETTAWAVYNNEARKVDNESIRDWTASLNFLLVFAAIFSAVLASFIIETKKLLEPDPGEEMVEVMVFYTNTLANGAPSAYNRIPFKPSTTAVSINCLLFGSLGASLVAALASVVALQWVAEFDATITRGGSSPQDRAERRQFRFAGVEKWKMGGIIATLPLLLYFSVVLFFVGVIQWMFLLHDTVGYVVAGGAAIAGLFYSLSTLVGVLFVSAPFKSPLSRSIYATFYLPFWISHWVMTIIQFKDVPKWVEDRRQQYLAAYKREDKAVESRDNLKYQAMHWLAEQLSISEDTRPRLFLLVGQLLVWPAAQLQSPDFLGGNWIKILNFLSRKYRRNLHLAVQSDEDGQELAMLVQCAALPAVAAIITPNEKHHYEADLSEYTYWTQYCVTSRGAESSIEFATVSLATPADLFLVTRDIPIPSLRSIEEVEWTQQLSKWRNSADKHLDVWQSLFSSSDRLSDDFFNASVSSLSSYVIAAATNSSQKIWRGKFNSIVMTIAARATKSGISSEALSALLRAFETNVHNTRLRWISTPKFCLDVPLVYTTSMGGWTDTEYSIHRSLALLMAQNLQGHDKSVWSRQLYELLGMLWLNQSNRYRDWSAAIEKYGLECRFDALHDTVVHDWILMVDKSPEIHEILRLLTQISLSQPEFGKVWLFPCIERGGEHLFAVLQMFDNLLREEKEQKRQVEIVNAICNLLQTDGLNTSENDTNSDRRNSIDSELKTIELRTIAFRALKTKRLSESMRNQIPVWSATMDRVIGYAFWNMLEGDARSVWELRASLLFDRSGQNFSDLTTRLLETAFSNSTQLPVLDRIFAHRAQCSRHSNSGPGHLLHHLQSAVPPRITFRSNVTLFDCIPLKGLGLAPITALFATSKVEDISLLKLPQEVSNDCMVQLWTYLDNIRSNQHRMIRLLLYLQSYHTPQAKWGSFAILLKAMEDSIKLPLEDASIPLLPLLAKRIAELPVSYYEFLSEADVNRYNAELTALLLHGQRITNVIVTKLAEVTAFGRIKSRIICCARASSGTQRASSYWPMYI